MRQHIYQIYYNEETHRKVLPGFIPLDNTGSLRPDWFEFWVMLNFLRDNVLEDNAFYGFLSPRFYEKTGFHSDFVINTIETIGDLADVFLFSFGQDQLCYFLNPFEQGEFWHPGLIRNAQDFVDQHNLKTDLSTLVTDTQTSVFSNYIIAKKEFWLAWQDIAEQYFAFVESDEKYQIKTKYGYTQNHYAMKTFIQERLATLILANGNHRALCAHQSLSGPFFTGHISANPKNRRLLEACDLMKSKYREKSDVEYLNMYWKIRADVHIRK